MLCAGTDTGGTIGADMRRRVPSNIRRPSQRRPRTSGPNFSMAVPGALAGVLLGLSFLWMKADGDASAGSAPFYPNCDAARAAGAAPLNQGDPGYRPPLDADGDGIACEP